MKREEMIRLVIAFAIGCVVCHMMHSTSGCDCGSGCDCDSGCDCGSGCSKCTKRVEGLSSCKQKSSP